MQTDSIETLRQEMFETLRGIKTKTITIEQAKEKQHQHASPRIKALWFAIPVALVPHVEHVPASAGVLVVREDGICMTMRKPTPRPDATKWTDAEMYRAARLAALRIWGLKMKIRKLKKPQKEA